jgi:hypothetical protein
LDSTIALVLLSIVVIAYLSNKHVEEEEILKRNKFPNEEAYQMAFQKFAFNAASTISFLCFDNFNFKTSDLIN